LGVQARAGVPDDVGLTALRVQETSVLNRPQHILVGVAGAEQIIIRKLTLETGGELFLPEGVQVRVNLAILDRRIRIVGSDAIIVLATRQARRVRNRALAVEHILVAAQNSLQRIVAVLRMGGRNLEIIPAVEFAAE